MPLAEDNDDLDSQALYGDADNAEAGAAAGEEEAGRADDGGDEEADAESLDDLDPEIRERVDRYYSRQRDEQRAAFRELGLDLNADGRPLIADAALVQQWAGPVLAPPPRAPVAEQPPTGAAPAPPAADEEEPFDPLAADGDAFRRLAQREAKRAIEPLLAENQRLQGLLQRRAESEAMLRLRETVRQRIPEIEGALEHPDFEPAYRQEISRVPAEYLEDPATVASIAALVRSRLDPARMPARRTDPAAASLAQNRANREGLAQTAPSRLGGAAPPDPGRDQEDAFGVRFLTRMRENMSPTAAARVDTSPAAWRELGENQDFDSWRRARDERRQAEARTGRRGR